MKHSQFIALQNQTNEYNYIFVEGEYQDIYYNVDQNLEIELDSFLLTIEVEAKADISLSEYTYSYPEDAEIDHESFEIKKLEIAVYCDDVEQQLTSKQEFWLYDAIEKYIEIQ